VKIKLTLLALCCCGFSFAQTKLIDSLTTVIAKHSGDTLEVLTLDMLAGELVRTDLTKAKQVIRQGLTLSKSIGYNHGISGAYARLVTLHQRTGNLDSAQYYLSLYTVLRNNYPNDKRVAINYANTTGLYYKTMGRPKEALPYMLESLHAIPANNKTRLAGQLLNVGNVYNDIGDFNNAVTYHLRSLTLFEEIKNARGQSFALQSLGSDFLGLNQYTTAEKYLLQSEKLKTELGDKRGMLSSWTSLGEVYRNLNKPDKAKTYLTKAIERAREFNATPDLKNLLYNMALVLKEEKKISEARQYFMEAGTIGKQSGDSLYVTKVRAELIMLNKPVKTEANEEQVLAENIRLSYEKGDHVNVAEGYDKLANWYAGQKQFEKAFTSLKRGYAVNDSLRGQEIILQLKRMEDEYQHDKKEKEIALLKKDQELKTLSLSRQKVLNTTILIVFIAAAIIGILLVNRYRVVNNIKRQVAIERVRNHIARDLHDDIGSTLSSINILSQVALSKNENTQDYFQRIKDQSSRMMENISDIVWSINPNNDTMKQVIIRMREFASEIIEPANMHYTFTEEVSEDLILDAAKRKNIFLIVKEAINNAVKYSEASQLTIALHQKNQILTIQINDNGKGFDEATIRSGNGLRNLRERTHEINGTITIASNPGSGTAIEFSIGLT